MPKMPAAAAGGPGVQYPVLKHSSCERATATLRRGCKLVGVFAKDVLPNGGV